MRDSNVLSELKQVLDELVTLLRTEGELRYSPWVLHAQGMVADANNDPDTLHSLKALARGVPTGPGTLYDLVLWRDDFEERKRINNRLDWLRSRVLDLIDLL